MEIVLLKARQRLVLFANFYRQKKSIEVYLKGESTGLDATNKSFTEIKYTPTYVCVHTHIQSGSLSYVITILKRNYKRE